MENSKENPKNWEIFNEMEKCIHEFEKVLMFRQDATFFEPEFESKCEHDIRDVEGTYVCIKCGVVEDLVLDTDGIKYENRKSFRAYQRCKHLGDIIKKLNGHYYFDSSGNPPPDILNQLSPDIKGIRKYLYKNKINIKNDYYYWLKKNDITTKIKQNHISLWTQEYRKQRNISPKYFLYTKMKDIAEYSAFAQLLEPKKINQIQSKDC